MKQVGLKIVGISQMLGFFLHLTQHSWMIRMSVNNFSADVLGKMLQIGNKKFNMRSIELFCKRKKKNL